MNLKLQQLIPQKIKSNKLLVLILLLTLISCEQDAVIDEQSFETNTQQKNSIETLNLDKLSLDRNFNNAIKNFGLKNILENNNSTFLKKSATEISVDTENIIEIKKKNYTSYTFRVIDKNSDKYTFKNLVVEQRNDTLQGFLIKYKYSQHYLEQLDKGFEIPFEGTLQRTPFFNNIEALFNTVNQSKTSNTAFNQSSNYICATSTLVGEKRCGSRSKHRVGEQCNLKGSNRAYYYTYTVTNCWYDNNTGLGGEEEVIDHIAVDDIPGGGGTTTTPNTPPCDNCDGNYLAKEISTRLGLFAQEEDWLEGLDEDPFVENLHMFLDNDNSLEATLIGKEIISFYKESNWKTILRQAVANGITSTAEVMHKIYKKLSQIAQQYPSSISYINIVVDEFREIAEEEFDTNPQTLDWLDLFGIWLFELGQYPQNTINFDGNDTTTESLKQQEGVNEARQLALNKIANNDLIDPTVSHPWTYGQGEFYDGMANGNIATSFLGSYGTNITITQNTDGSYTLTFTVSNPSTWESATRLRIDNDNDGNHDGIFPNKNRGDGIHLGGTINQTWIWTEIVN